MVFPVIGGDGKPTGYEIDNSVRFSGSRELTFTPGQDGTKTTFTISCWAKKCENAGERQVIFGAQGGSDYLRWNDDETLNFHIVDNSATRSYTSFAKFRDPSAWYHIVAIWNTTDGTNANRMQVYVNGELVTPDSQPTISQNAVSTHMNDSSQVHHIAGEVNPANDFHFAGYLAEFHFIDGSAKAPTDFGETNDNGVWIPKKYAGSYGTNGFFLEFKQTGTSQNASGIGADTSGNDNHFAVTDLEAKDVVTDTPTNNFATLNPLAGNSQLTANGYFFGNTRVNANVVGVGNSNYLMSISSIGVTSGKWYAEFKPTGNLYSSGTDSSSLIGVGSGIYKAGDGNHNTAIGGFTHWWLDHDDDRVIVDGNVGNTNMNSGTHVQANDIIGVYLNCDTTMPTVTFQKNGAALGGATNSPYNVRRTGSYNIGDNNPIFFMPVVRYGDGSNWGRFECNFGNPPNLPSSGNTDANGYGNFEYSPTLGGVEYYALCTKNLAEYG